MQQAPTLERLVARVSAQVRRRRAEHYALRGAFWSSLAAVVVLLFKGPLGGWALPLAGGLFLAGTLGGLAWGAFKRTPSSDAARLADRAWGLEDRVATATRVGGPLRPHADGRCARGGRARRGSTSSSRAWPPAA